MLSCLYRLADLDLEEPVRIWERRGSVTIDLARTLYTPVGASGLNVTLTQLFESGKWFQLWRGEIVSMRSPATPRIAGPTPMVGQQPGARPAPKGGPRLTVEFVLTNLCGREPVLLRQGRGRVRFLMSPRCFTPQGLVCGGIGALTAASQEVLRGGQWIQVWDGEIITMYDGEPGQEGESDGRIHRGPVVQEGTR